MDTLVELCVSRERLPAVPDVVFGIGCAVLAERRAVETVFDCFPGELERDGLSI
jgi:hypothetical protein